MLRESDRIELELHFLAYSRYVSRAHTIFSTCVGVILAIIFGTIGVVFSLIEIEYIVEFNKFNFLKTLFYSGFLIMGVVVLAVYKWYESRIIRIKIIKQIKDIQNKS